MTPTGMTLGILALEVVTPAVITLAPWRELAQNPKAHVVDRQVAQLDIGVTLRAN